MQANNDIPQTVDVTAVEVRDQEPQTVTTRLSGILSPLISALKHRVEKNKPLKERIIEAKSRLTELRNELAVELDLIYETDGGYGMLNADADATFDQQIITMEPEDDMLLYNSDVIDFKMASSTDHRSKEYNELRNFLIENDR
jgi:hypothetical protein